jgi:transcription antitermination factor NusG
MSIPEVESFDIDFPPTILTESRASDGIVNSRRVMPEDCPAEFPAGLLAGPRASHAVGHAGEPAWWLAHTLPRQEKIVATALLSRRVPYYLPLVTRKSLTRGRTRVARIPLFPGYVFVHGDGDQRLAVLKTNRVLALRQVSEGEKLRMDLRRFAELIALGAPLVPEARLVAGDRVRVKAGPFRGQEGVVLRRNGKTRLLIAINYLQRGASLEVDDCLLEFV